MGAACHTDAQQTFGFCKSEEPRTNKRDMEKMGLVQIRASPSFTYRSQSEAEMSDTEYINYTSHDEDSPKQDKNEHNNNTNNNNDNNDNKNKNNNLIQHQTQIQSKNYNETENEKNKKKNEAQLGTPQTNTSFQNSPSKQITNGMGTTDQLSLNSSRNSVIIGKDDRQDDANSIISSNRDRALSLDNNSVSGRSNRSSVSNVSGMITNPNFQQLNMQNPPQCFPDTIQNIPNMQNGAIPPVTIPVVSTPTQFGMSLPMDSAMSSYHVCVGVTFRFFHFSIFSFVCDAEYGVVVCFFELNVVTQIIHLSFFFISLSTFFFCLLQCSFNFNFWSCVMFFIFYFLFL